MNLLKYFYMPKDINSIQSGIVQSNNVNDPTPRTLKGHNQFPQSFQHPSTCQYGYVDPVAVAKCEVGDLFPYKFVTDLNTFTMKSPLKSQVKMYSAAFKVPMEAIYPRTYDILFAFAQKGSQVPQDSPTGYNNASFENSARAILPLRFLVTEILSLIDNNDPNEFTPDSISSEVLNLYLRSIILLESIFSAGSVFSKMNIHLNSTKFIFDDSLYSFDSFFDLVLYPKFTTSLDQHVYLMHESGDTTESGGYPIYVPTLSSSLYGTSSSSDFGFDGISYYCSFDRFFELIRTGEWNVYFAEPEYGDTNLELYNSIYIPLSLDPIVRLPEYLNIEPIIAYQLACVHFFNNPKVDYLYTVDLWRSNLQSIISPVYNNLYGRDTAVFDYNGTDIFYDVISYPYLHSASFFTDNFDFDVVSDRIDYLMHLFSFARSLRYGDYFTGSRPEPIGVGDITLDEGSSGISSLEVARKLQLTRLLHKVAITGPEHSEQIKVVFGGNIPEAPKDVPIRLSLEEFDIDGFEVNNTGDAQLSPDSQNITTTNLRLSDSKFMFEVEVNEPCWLVMVQYFEAHRIYANTIDRFAYHYDLFDDFVPDMQFVGDQDVKQSELHGVYGNQFDPFSYNLRYMEYKQRYSYASGGFIEFLPSWAFITDNKDGNPADANITPEYIRSSPSEFDRFYKSLTGHSLGSRFHFITMNTNVMAPYRQMVYAPEILA